MTPPTILILDDDDDLRESLVSVFAVLGKECLALSSVDALIAAQPRVLACELALLDVNLGEGAPSGLDAYEWLCEHDYAGHCVFLTGHALSHPVIARAASLGAQVLQKPIAAADLRALSGDAHGA